MADLDRRLRNATHTIHPLDEDDDTTTEHMAEDPLIDRMVRKPTEADFDDVLTPEGNSGDIVGSDVSDSTTPNNSSVMGLGL